MIVLSNSQYAYRKSRSTELTILNLVNNILNNFDNNKITIAVFLDLTRAFDCVDHGILCRKLEHYGIRGNALKWFKEYLSDRKQYVTFDGTRSLQQTINIGVPLGSILGPLLFLIYINDFCNITEHGKQLLFADDATHFDSDSDLNILLERVNHNLNILVQWFLSNRLSINIIKTEAMLFTRKTIYFPLPPVILQNNPIPFNFSFKFLGMILDFRLNWKHHIRRIQTKLSNVCGILYKIRNMMSRSLLRTVYLSLAYPHLNYGNIIWSSCSNTLQNSIFITQKKIVRTIMRKKRSEPSSPLFKELNLLKLMDICNLNTASFVFKTIKGLIPSPIIFMERDAGPYNLRGDTPLEVPFVRSHQSRRFIHVKGAQLWNDLVPELRNLRTLFSFKRNLKLMYTERY